MFSLNLGTTSSLSTVATGELVLGGIDPSYSSFVYTPATFNTNWIVTATSFSFGTWSIS